MQRAAEQDRVQELPQPAAASAPRQRKHLLVACAVVAGCHCCFGAAGEAFAEGRPTGTAAAGAGAAAVGVGGDSEGGSLGTTLLVLAMAVYYGMSYKHAKAKQAFEMAAGEPPAPTEPLKKPRIDAFDSLRFCLIFYIASGHFIATATRNMFILRLVSQINVVVGAFFVLSGYVAAYTTTELGQRKGSRRLDNAVEFAITRIMGFWPLHMFVLVIFSRMFMWVDCNYNGLPVALWHGFISATLMQSWFPLSAEVWNPPTWFLSAFAFALCVLPYALRILAGQTKAQLRRTLVILTLFSFVPKLGYSYDLKAWDLMEGVTSARAHPNYALFNVIRFTPFAAVLEVLMGAVACRLVMLDDAEEGKKSGSAAAPLAALIGIVVLRATGHVELNDMLVRSGMFIPLWIVFMMRLHRNSVAPGGANKFLPKALCNKTLLYLGSISFPIFIVHGPIGQVFYKKAVVTWLFGGPLSSPSETGIDPFFAVYWLVVLVAAALCQKKFVERDTVKSFSKDLGAAIIKAL